MNTNIRDYSVKIEKRVILAFNEIREEIKSMNTELTITNPNFESEGWMPDRYSGYGEDISPKLCINDLSDDAVSLAITLDDLGHPLQPGYSHWVAWNLPPVNVIPENLPKGATVDLPLSIVQGVGYGKHCYRQWRDIFYKKGISMGNIRENISK